MSASFSWLESGLKYVECVNSLFSYSTFSYFLSRNQLYEFMHIICEKQLHAPIKVHTNILEEVSEFLGNETFTYILSLPSQRLCYNLYSQWINTWRWHREV